MSLSNVSERNNCREFCTKHDSFTNDFMLIVSVICTIVSTVLVIRTPGILLDPTVDWTKWAIFCPLAGGTTGLTYESLCRICKMFRIVIEVHEESKLQDVTK